MRCKFVNQLNFHECIGFAGVIENRVENGILELHSPVLIMLIMENVIYSHQTESKVIARFQPAITCDSVELLCTCDDLRSF